MGVQTMLQSRGIGATAGRLSCWLFLLGCCLSAVSEPLAPAQTPTAKKKLTAKEKRLARQAKLLEAEVDDLSDEGRYEEAAAKMRKIVAIRRQLYRKDRFPKGHLALAVSISELAVLYANLGKDDRAE